MDIIAAPTCTDSGRGTRDCETAEALNLHIFYYTHHHIPTESTTKPKHIDVSKRTVHQAADITSYKDRPVGVAHTIIPIISHLSVTSLYMYNHNQATLKMCSYRLDEDSCD